MKIGNLHPRKSVKSVNHRVFCDQTELMDSYELSPQKVSTRIVLYKPRRPRATPARVFYFMLAAGYDCDPRYAASAHEQTPFSNVCLTLWSCTTIRVCVASDAALKKAWESAPIRWVSVMRASG